jgi:hypothetical protein
MDTAARTRTLLKISLIIAGLIVLFFSGLFPIEDLLTYVPQAGLTASVVPADVASLTNQQRQKNGLPELAVSPLLTEAAQLKANDMATKSYYAHVGPDGKTPLDWLKAAGYNYLNAGENLVIDRDTSKEAVAAWMNSPEHRENILRPQFTEIGIGVAKGKYDGLDTIFVVQEFGTPYPTHAVAVAAPKVVKTAPIVTSAPKASTTPIVSKPKPVAAPALAIAQLPKPAIVSDAASVVKSVISKPVISIATTTAMATSTVQEASSTATSTVTYSLAPEFFAPVVLSAPKTPAEQADPQALEYIRPTVIQKISLYISRISMAVRSAL